MKISKIALVAALAAGVGFTSMASAGSSTLASSVIWPANVLFENFGDSDVGVNMPFAAEGPGGGRFPESIPTTGSCDGDSTGHSRVTPGNPGQHAVGMAPYYNCQPDGSTAWGPESKIGFAIARFEGYDPVRYGDTCMLFIYGNGKIQQEGVSCSNIIKSNGVDIDGNIIFKLNYNDGASTQ